MTSQETGSGERETKVTVTRSERGWDVLETRDDEVVRRVTYSDWHRVERAVEVRQLDARRLRRAEAPSTASS
jgi:hypothetical protein